MTHLDDERLVDLALGEDAARRERAHLDQCRTCTQSLAGLVSTVDLTRSMDGSLLVAPPPRVWQAIEAELQITPAPVTAVEAQPTSDVSEASQASSHPRSPEVPSLEHRRQRRAQRSTRPAAWLLAAACVLGVVLGVGGAGLANRIGGESDPAQFTVASTQLAPLDSPTTAGVATLVDRGGTLDLTLSTAELDPGEGYLEVWLINRDLTRMVSIGVLPTTSSEIVLPISQELIDQGYVIVDISREEFDDQPAHSGNTLVRGELAI